MSIPMRPYLQNAVSGYHKEFGNGTQRDYVEWMQAQGVVMPIKQPGRLISDSVIEFTDPELEAVFILRWA